MPTDLRGASMEAVARFWFDRPVEPPGTPYKENWASKYEVCNAEEFVPDVESGLEGECVLYQLPEAAAQLAWLFSNTASLRRVYSEAQLMQGFQGLGLPQFGDMVSWWLRDAAIPVDAKVRVFDAIAQFHDDNAGTPLLATGLDWLESTWTFLVEPNLPDREALLSGVHGCMGRLLDCKDKRATATAMDILSHLQNVAETKQFMGARGYVANPEPKRYGEAWLPRRST